MINTNTNTNTNNATPVRRYADKFNRVRKVKAEGVAKLNTRFALFAHVVEPGDHHVVRFINATTGVVYHRVPTNAPDLMERAARFAKSMREPHDRGRANRFADTADGACISYTSHVASILRVLLVNA